MRVVSLGPTDEDAITALVDSCTTTVFGKSRPARAIGAAAANSKRREVKEEKAKGKMPAADVIKGANNKAVSGDGTEAPTAASEVVYKVAFPEDKYKTDVPMPTLDRALKGKKILYLFDDQDGNGLKLPRRPVRGRALQRLFNTLCSAPISRTSSKTTDGVAQSESAHRPTAEERLVDSGLGPRSALAPSVTA